MRGLVNNEPRKLLKWWKAYGLQWQNRSSMLRTSRKSKQTIVFTLLTLMSVTRYGYHFTITV